MQFKQLTAVLALMANTGYAVGATIDELDAWQISNEDKLNRWERSCSYTSNDGTETIGESVAGTQF